MTHSPKHLFGRVTAGRMPEYARRIYASTAASAGTTAGTSCVQNAQRVAWMGMLLRQYGQSRVVGSAGGSDLRRAISAFMGFTTKKKITAARMIKATIAVMNVPILIWLPLITQ